MENVEKHEIDEMKYFFVVWEFPCFANGEGEILRKVCEISQSFARILPLAKQRKLQTIELCHFVNFMICPQT